MIFMLSIGFWLSLRVLDVPAASRRDAFLLGLVAGLAFLSRHIGIAFGVAVVTLLLVQSGRVRGSLQKTCLRRLVVAVLGFLSVVGPYGMALYYQSGQSLLTQHFRLGEYVVTVPGATGEGRIAREVGSESGSYKALIERRRAARELLPDASEMYGNLVGASETGRAMRMVQSVREPRLLLDRLTTNFRHLEEPLGPVLPYAVLFTVVTSLLVRLGAPFSLARTLMPAFLIVYFVMLSALTAAVGRYVHVLFGFVILTMFLEAHRLLAAVKLGEHAKNARRFALLCLVGATLGLTPRLFSAAITIPKVNESSALSHCDGIVSERAPVFALHPLYAYLLGGTPRSLPNDSLAKVAHYAQRTGVHWMILVDRAVDAAERKMYTNSPWLFMPDLASNYPEFIRLRCHAAGGRVALFEFVGRSPGAE